MRPIEVNAPAGSRIAQRLQGASFHDAWCVHSNGVERPALQHFIDAARQTPAWIDACMALRNNVGQLVGLKNLGSLSAVARDKPAEAYVPGDRVGIFTVFENSADEALIGDKDKHLDVVLSIHRSLMPGEDRVAVTVTTVVHVKSMLGTLYMLPVKPMHRLIAPAVLSAAARPGPRANAA